MQKITLNQEQQKKLNSILNRYSSYAKFSATKKDAYEYTAILGVRVCPYCNINYTYTVYERPGNDGLPGTYSSPVCRPDLDHFKAQSAKAGEGLGLAQQNLVPSCQQCNSRIKLRQIFHSTTHIHPFEDDFDSIKRFTIDLNSPDFLNRGNFTIRFVDRSLDVGDVARANKSISDLKLVPRYQYHKEEVLDLFKKAAFYHRHRLKEIGELVGEGISAIELRRHLFLSELRQINESPLAKLRRDILEIILR